MSFETKSEKPLKICIFVILHMPIFVSNWWGFFTQMAVFFKFSLWLLSKFSHRIVVLKSMSIAAHNLGKLSLVQACVDNMGG